MSVTVRHPLAHLIAGAAPTWNDVLAGRWSIAADLCRARLDDPVAAGEVLDSIGASFAVPADAREPLEATVGDGFVKFHADVARVASALDLFSRVLCGQWDEMRWHTTIRGAGQDRDVDLCALRVSLSRRYDPEAPRADRSFPDHPFASIGIAESELPAKVAYHAYKQLGGGAPGEPTFALPDGPLTVEVSADTTQGGVR